MVRRKSPRCSLADPEISFTVACHQADCRSVHSDRVREAGTVPSPLESLPGRKGVKMATVYFKNAPNLKKKIRVTSNSG